MKNEETIYNDENTQYDDTQEVKNEETNQPKKGATWRKVAFGTGTGILLGGAASFATTKVMAATGEEEEQPENENTRNPPTPCRTGKWTSQRESPTT